MHAKKTQTTPIESLQYAMCAVIALLVATYVFHLWSIDLHLPLIGYGGDDLQALMEYKTIVETGWVYVNPAIGAPFGSVLLDIPSGNGLHFLLGLVLSRFTRQPELIYNLYYLAGFPLAAITSLLFLRKIKIPFQIALPGAIAFSFLPFHLLRYHHLWLASYYMLPLGLLAILQAANGDLTVFTWDEQRRTLKFDVRQRRVSRWLIVCVMAASSGVYYAYFMIFVACISAVRCLSLGGREPRLSRSLNCVGLACIFAVAAAINGAPYYIYGAINKGLSEPAVVRSRLEAELYGLRVIQLLLPSAIHRVPQLAAATLSYNATAPLVNENSTASLGLIGGVGFLYSLLVLFRQHSKTALDDYLGFINIACVLLATIGGFGSGIDYFLFQGIRAYNRISVVIGLVSVAAFCRLAQHAETGIGQVIRSKNAKTRAAVSTAVGFLLLGAVFVDQCYFPNFESAHRRTAIAFENDERFARAIENDLPAGAMVFELPFMRYPENGPINKVGDYDEFRPYLHSSGLRWSYGGVKGREASDWNKATAALPTEQMLRRLAAAGFAGIYVDRFGYEDAARQTEASICVFVKTPPIVSDDNRFVFYDIRTYARQDLK